MPGEPAAPPPAAVSGDAVADGRLDARRYDSYCQMVESPGDAVREDFDEL